MHRKYVRGLPQHPGYISALLQVLRGAVEVSALLSGKSRERSFHRISDVVREPEGMQQV